MGSFNTTCAISHAPIRPNDKVRLMFIGSAVSYKEDILRDNLFQGSSIEPSEDFQVIGGIALKCTYQDYNNYELITNDIFSDYVMSQVKKHYCMRTDASNAEMNNISKEELTFEKAIEMANEGGLWFNPRPGNTRYNFCNIMAVHEEVWQAWIGKTVKCYWWDEDGESKSGVSNRKLEDYIRVAVKNDSYITESDEYKDMYAELTLAVDGIKPDNPSKKIMTHEKAHDAAYNAASFMLQCERSTYAENRWVYGSITPLKALTQLNNTRAERVSMETLIREVEEMSFFNTQMYAQNHKYIPMQTSGQEYDLTQFVDNAYAIAIALEKTNASSYSDDLQLKHVITRHNSISLTELIIFINEVYSPGDQDFTQLSEMMEDFKHQSVLLKTDTVVITKSLFEKPDYEILAELISNTDHDLHITIDC